MASFIYDAARESFLRADLDWDAHTIKVVFIDAADYTAVQATDDFLNDVPSAARVGTAQTLASKTTTAGVADAADVTFTALSGDPCEGVLVFRDTGTESTSNLVAYYDISATPLTPNGGNVTLSFNASGLFKL